MKNQNHIGLLVGCFTSLMLYVLLFFWDASLELSELRSVLRLSVSAVPVFFLQLWLCRLENVRWTRWLPLCTLFLVAMVGAAYFFGFVGSGWDTLGGRYPPMLVHCPSGGVCFGLADLRWETPAQAGYGRAGHSAGGLCETQSYGWTFWRFRVNGLARHSRSGDGDMVAA